MVRREVDWATTTRYEMAREVDAVSILAALLRNGQLVLLLGAGISMPMGLPSWKDLVDRCAALMADGAGGDPILLPADLMRAIDKIKREATRAGVDFQDILRQSLYQDVARGGIDDTFDSHVVASNPMLGAIGAMVMSSARGSAAEVFTLNFDDLLEWYLFVHGFSTQVVAEMPVMLSDAVDVHVYHLHGFLPHHHSQFESSKTVILSQLELEERLAMPAEAPWESLLLNRLHGKVFLALGTSMRDTDIGASLVRTRRYVEDRPLGFVLGCHDEDARDELFARGLIPVTVPTLDAVPDFLLAVCQAANGE